jgi:hypothetical protein
MKIDNDQFGVRVVHLHHCCLPLHFVIGERDITKQQLELGCGSIDASQGTSVLRGQGYSSGSEKHELFSMN